METVQIKEQLQNLIDYSNGAQLAYIYRILEDKGIEFSTRISVDQYNRELDESEAEFEKGNYISQEELIEKSKKW